ncbi:chlorobactene glucosyltransferase [Pedobacter westerhofensis]|uniref:Chlorobactene glucosyltransferase n=1 Tax=Pedobacter westerhofensis TaxID=425512 RepID=A0A521AEV8_9SPHI|nr:glycosyltransferase family A protein [Pedobacter westerhofensis]SMO33337.1 chlorobactene glucosyltransferase [Pedobacter westerhofensis]
MSIILIPIFIFLFLRLFVAGYNFFSRPNLQISEHECRDRISILIPVRNEEQNISALLFSILKQSYQNYEVIILDDSSTDQTLQLANDFAKSNPNFRVVSGKQLEEGWTGKNFACWQLAREASGKYLLFLDADVTLAPELLNSALCHLKRNDLSLLSLFSNQTMNTLGENSVIPLMNYLLLTLLPIRLILSHSNPIFAAACGQFMLFAADNYQQHQWHSKVKQEVTEDLKIMKLIKVANYKGEGLLANGLISCRMYNNYTDAVNGFSKNFIAPFNDSIPLFILFLVSLLLGPVFIIATSDAYLISLLFFIIVLTRSMTSSLSGQNVWLNAFLHPLQMLSLLHIGCLAIQRTSTKTRKWKGRMLS